MFIPTKPIANQDVPSFKVVEDPVQYLYTYFKVGYYLCAIPFRFKKNPRSPSDESAGDYYILRQNRLQQLIVYIIYAWGLYKYIPSFYATSFEKTRLSSFDLVALMTSLCNKISFIYFMTWRRKELLAIVNFVRQDQHDSGAILSTRRRISWIVGTTTFCYCTIGAIYTLGGISVVKADQWDPKIIWASYVGQAKFNFFLRKRDDAVKYEDITLGDHIGTGFYVLLKASNQICSHFPGNGFFTLTLMMHHLARDFKGLMSKVDVTGIEVVNRFWKLFYFYNNYINDVYGVMIFWWIFEAIPYYTGNLDSIFSEVNPMKQLRNIIYITNLMATLLLASDSHYKVRLVAQLKDWIIERRSKVNIPDSDLTILLHALSPSEVGLKAWGFFTITYDFIGTIANAIITYAIILIGFIPPGEVSVSFHGYNNIL